MSSKSAIMRGHIETVHHHELVSFAIYRGVISLRFGSVTIDMSKLEFVSSALWNKHFEKSDEAAADLDALLRPLIGKRMQRWIMDADSFRLAFDDWSFLTQNFGLKDSLVEIWGPEPDAYIAYPQAILDLNPEVKEAVQALKRKQAEVEAYLAEAGSDMSAQSTELLRRLHQRFETEANHDLSDFRYQHGSMQGALLYARLFVPEFKVIAGRVILDDGSAPQAYAKAVAESPQEEVDPDSFNWIEVVDLFSNNDTGLDPHNYDDDEILAALIADAWRGRLLALFPDRTFVVEIIPPEITGYVVGVGFREVRAIDRH